MRNDMFKVIVERPRVDCARGTEHRREERSARALERAPSKAGMRGGIGRRKYLNENLAPLVRFLERRVGRPWSRVRSEMSAVLSLSSAVQKHVLDHVRQFVEENPVMIGGRPHEPIARGGAKGAHLPLGLHSRWRGRFYVCPRTGVLREAPREPRKRKAGGDSGMDAGATLGQ